VLLAGAPEVFCAGNDLNDFVAMARSGALGAPIVRFLHALARCEKPLVAAVSGAAVGVGTTMLLHCDQVIAADNAVLLTPFVSLGLLPEAGSSLIAPRLMGHAQAFSLLVMGKPLSAVEAKDAGIVNAVVPVAELDAHALTAARDIAALPPQSVTLARRLMRGSSEDIVARIDEEVEAFKVRLLRRKRHSPRFSRANGSGSCRESSWTRSLLSALRERRDRTNCWCCSAR
jgi:enoyl-CoA hydratase/carnithine racemase